MREEEGGKAKARALKNQVVWHPAGLSSAASGDDTQAFELLAE